MHDFIHKLIQQINLGIPGVEAQYKMAPTRRLKPDESYYQKKQAAPKSSVLILLYPKNNSIYFVLIERPKYQGTHSGQISFPGGKIDANDLSPSYTAIRETFEEIGVNISQENIIAQLTSLYIPASNFEVFPFLAWCNFQPVFIPNKREVAAILETPISMILNNENISNIDVPIFNGLTYNAPCFNLLGKNVWGATAMILSELKEIIKLSGAELHI